MLRPRAVDATLGGVRGPWKGAARGHRPSCGLAGAWAPAGAAPGPRPACAPLACGLATGRLLPRHGERAPSRAGSSPDSRGPPPKNLVLASSVIIGLVNRNTTTTSMSVVRPRVNAKIWTSETATLYTTPAPR